MTEKRRGGSSKLVTLIIIVISFLILWRYSGCPGPPYFVPEPPGFLLILPGNVSTLPNPYALQALPPNDMKNLIDLKNFKFTINNQICNGSAPFVLVIVHSDPRNTDKREAIRNTWGTRLKVVFMFGEPFGQDLQKKIVGESETFRDVVQGNFRDAYRNMTYKHIMGLKWASYYCSNARYILKTDDDVFVHPSALLHYLHHSLSPYGARRLILCQPFAYGLVRRSYRSKWRVTYSEFSGPLYPSYCPGWAILYSPDVVFRLYLESHVTPYFWIDDVFVTGLLAARANFGRTALNDLILDNKRMRSLADKKPNEDFFIFGPNDISIEDIYWLWNIVKTYG